MPKKQTDRQSTRLKCEYIQSDIQKHTTAQTEFSGRTYALTHTHTHPYIRAHTCAHARARSHTQREREIVLYVYLSVFVKQGKSSGRLEIRLSDRHTQERTHTP